MVGEQLGDYEIEGGKVVMTLEKKEKKEKEMMGLGREIEKKRESLMGIEMTADLPFKIIATLMIDPTTFGLDYLRSLGHAESTVFSPIHMLITLSVYHLKGNDYHNHSLPMFKGLSENEALGLWEDWSNEMLSLGGEWPYGSLTEEPSNPPEGPSRPWHECQRTGLEKFFMGKKFGATLMKDKPKSKLLEDKRKMFKFAIDDVFEVVAVPYSNQSVWLVFFIPRNVHDLKKALKALDSTRFRNLLDDLDYDLLDFQLPTFDVFSPQTLTNSFGIHIKDCRPYDPPTIGQTSKIWVTTDKVLLNIKNNFMSVGITSLTHLPGETQPLFVHNLTSFIFALVHDKTPLFLGIRKT